MFTIPFFLRIPILTIAKFIYLWNEMIFPITGLRMLSNPYPPSRYPPSKKNNSKTGQRFTKVRKSQVLNPKYI